MQAAGLGNREQAGRGKLSSGTTVAEADLSPLHAGSQRTLGAVVGGFDAGFMNERPHSIAVIEDVLARAANAANAKAHPRL